MVHPENKRRPEARHLAVLTQNGSRFECFVFKLSISVYQKNYFAVSSLSSYIFLHLFELKTTKINSHSQIKFWKYY